VDVRLATDALLKASHEAGLDVEGIRSGPAFARLLVTGPRSDTVLVDLGYDHRMRPAEPTPLGPALALEELGADKLLALFGRAEARDFVDVHALTARFGMGACSISARRRTAGFDPYVLATMLGNMARLPRSEFDVDDATYARLESFYRSLRAQLIQEALGNE